MAVIDDNQVKALVQGVSGWETGEPHCGTDLPKGRAAVTLNGIMGESALQVEARVVRTSLRGRIVHDGCKAKGATLGGSGGWQKEKQSGRG